MCAVVLVHAGTRPSVVCETAGERLQALYVNLTVRPVAISHV